MSSVDTHLDVDLHMFQAWLVYGPYSEFCTFSNLLFHKYGGENIGITNYMSHFYMFESTKANVKLANGNTGPAQGFGIILWHFANCHIIYMVGPVHYFPGNTFNTVSLGAFKVYVGIQKVTYEPFEHCVFLSHKVFFIK